MTESDRTHRPHGAARPRWALFGGLAAVIVVADQLTKAALMAALGPGQSTVVLGDWVRLVHGQNTGAIFGLFRENAALFALVSLAVIAIICWFQARAGGALIVAVALGLLLGGAIGNFIDRIRLGYVVDFVDIGIGSLRWYTFNVADAAISTSIVLLVLAGLFPRLAQGGAAEASGGGAAGG